MGSNSAEFTRLWTTTLPKVSAFVGSMVFDPNDRDDVLQDIAVAAIGAFESYDSSRPFAAWAIGIARNQVRLYLRRKSKSPLPFDDEALAALVHAFADFETSVENRKLAHLQHCLGKLEGQPRELCEYRYAQNLKPAAIAEKLGLRPNTVAKALQRARDELRACIEKSIATS